MRQPNYAGINTFLGAEYCEPKALEDDVDIGVLGLPFDGGVTNEPGARYGPEALRKASDIVSREYAVKKQLFDVDTRRAASYSSIEIRDCGDAPVVPTDIEETFTRVRSRVKTVAENAFPVLLGGDHSLTYPTFTGYAATVEEDVGLVHLDAHSDAWGPSDLYGEYYHSSPMNHIAASEYGAYSNFAVVGLRGHVDMDFVNRMESDGLHVERARDVSDRGVRDCVETAFEHASAGVNHVYLTIDIDVVDPAFAPGTGTPSPGGLTSSDVLRAVETLGNYPKISAVDLMEVAPPLDPTNNTSLLGAIILSRFIQSYFSE